MSVVKRALSAISPVFLLAAAAPLVSAQSYQFTSCSSNVVFKVNIGSIISKSGPNELGGTGSRSTVYIFNSSSTMTRGRTTLNSTGIGSISILLAPNGPPGSPLGTTFIIQVPNENGDGPGTGRAREDRAWGVTLVGLGDLIPGSSLPSTLPALSKWAIPLVGTSPDRIVGDGKLYGQIDSFTGCSGFGKGLGDPGGAAGSCSCGDPISVGSGNMFEMVADYQAAGPNKFGFTRYYNSQGGSITLASTLGANWRSTYDRYLRIVSPTSVTAERPEGRQVSFTLTGGAWTTDTDVDLKLTNSGTSWTLTDTDDSVETYRTTGASQALLLTIRARNGYTQTLDYNATNQLTGVSDSFNRRLGFTYSNGQLRTVTTPDGLELTYRYTVNGDYTLLTSVGYSTSPPTSQTYLYDNTSLPYVLTGIIDENGSRYATWTYDLIARALSSQHSGGANITRIAYDDYEGTRTVTNAFGSQMVYRVTTLQGALKVTQIDRLATPSVTAATIKFTYDNNGYLASQTDWNGAQTTFVNDVHGQPTSAVMAAGTPLARTKTITYHATFHLPARIVEPGMTSTFTYDTTGNLLSKTVTDTTTTTAPYATNGVSRTWTYTWANFLLASVKNPSTDVPAVTRFTYDSSGALTNRTNPLGQVTRVTDHLPGGLPQTAVDANGVVTHLTYDARLRLLSRTVDTAAGPLTTTYNYDNAGNLTGVIQPDGAAITNVYDAAHRLKAVTDVLGQTMAYSLDPLGGRTQTNMLDSGGERRGTHSMGFSALGRVLVDIGGAGQVTTYTHDANGNPLTVTSPSGQVTQRAFDAFNRVVRTTDPAKGVTTMSYDAHDRRTSVTDPNGAVTSYVYDGFGDLIQQVSPDSGTTIYRYDLNGNLAQRVDASGAVVDYTYDALDRVITVTYPANPAENVTNTYDEDGHGFGVGKLTTIADAAGSLSRSYEERGNLLTETRVNGGVTLVTTYTYDAANRIASLTYPSGWKITYTRDAMGRAIAVTAQNPDGSDPIGVVSGVGYQPFGPVNALTFGNGVTETRTFDLGYRVTSINDAGTNTLQSLTYSYNSASNVSSIDDGVTAENSQSFNYDALERLTSATGGYGSFGYSYDGVGNRLTKSFAGSSATYTYATRSNQLASVSANGESQTVGHTRHGHIDKFGLASAATNSLSYNQAGRLSSVTEGEKQLAQYTYDAFGRRLIKAGAVTTTLYQYDRKGHLLEEADGQGAPQVDYIYLDALPVATISAGQIYFLHNDRLGAPQIATDSSQSVVWSANYAPFGEASTRPSLIAQNLRLPGQEFDVDTGLYHNGFRDYAPGWGRYLQSDPIGLAGGLNTYGYAEGNPVNSIDPFGLCTITSTDDVITLDFADGSSATIPVQVWLNMTSAQQVALLWEILSGVNDKVQEPSLLEWLFRYVGGLVEKNEPQQEPLPSGGGIRG